MARGVNKAILMGNLGADPETRYTPNGNAVTNFSMATDESYKDKQTGQLVAKTEWHRIVMFGKLAEVASQYMRKGSKCYIEGKLQTRKWQGQDGQDRWTTEVVVDINGQLRMLDGAPSNDSQGGHQNGQPQNQQQYNQQAYGRQQAAGGDHVHTPGSGMTGPVDDFDDDIPF